jgi:hypothetical protein
MTTGGRPQPGCMMKILEAERWQKSANPHEVALLQWQQEEDKIDNTTTQETKSASSPTVRSLGGGPDADPSSEHWRAPSRGPEGGRARRMEEKRGMAIARGMSSFLKEDFPARASKRHERVSPMHTKVSSLRHGSPTLHDLQLVRWGGEGESPRKERVTTSR